VNIIERQVSQATRDGDTFTIPPLRVLYRHLDLYNTILYDCLELGASFAEVQAEFTLDNRFTEGNVREYVARHGRVIVDKWLNPAGWTGHVEPV